MRPHVAALVLNWRLPEPTLACVRDLLACGTEPLSVLVMDNGSGDGSAERLRAALPAEVEVRAFEENLGYCAAMNRGLAWARERDAELVLLLNNDMRLPAGFLEPLVEGLVHDPDVAGVGPTMLRPDGKVWCQGGRLAFAPNTLKLAGEGGEPAPTTTGPVAVDFMPGACALYRLADLEAVGDLDESYWMYWEDVALGHALRARGKKILWLPWSRVTHASAASLGGQRAARRKYMCAVNSVRYLKRHGTAKQWLAFAVFDCLLWPATFLSGTGPRAMLAKARGLVAGARGRTVDRRDVEG